MRVIIAGSRSFSHHPKLSDIVAWGVEASPFKNKITYIISGGAEGIDQEAIKYAKCKGIDFIIVPAAWNLFGRAAGHIRNKDMAIIHRADALIAIYDGISSGTIDMVTIMRDLDKPIHLVTIPHSY